MKKTKKTILVSVILIAALLLLVSPVAAAANSRTYTVNVNGRTAIYAMIDEEEEEDALLIAIVGDLVVKLPGQKAQVVEGVAQIAIGLEGGFFDFWAISFDDLEEGDLYFGTTFDWSMAKCVVTVPLPDDETGILTWTAIEPPTATHTSIDFGELLGIPDLNLVIRLNAVVAPATVEAEPETGVEVLLALISVGTLNIVVTPPSLD